MRDNTWQLIFLLIAGMVLFAWLYRRRWRPSGSACGTAHWASEAMLRAAGMLGETGIVLGRTLRGKPIRIKDYVHLLLIGATGAGKGVAVIIPNLLSYVRGSIVCFDTKGDLYATCGRRRAARGWRVIRLAPFNGGAGKLNPLDLIPPDSPMLVDHARAMAEALVVRLGTEAEPHWNDKAAQAICALLVLVLLQFRPEERNLNSVQEIASDPEMLAAAAEKLRGLGGIPARLGNQLRALFDDAAAGKLSKEGSGVVSTVCRHLAFLDSELVARSVAASTFDPRALLKGGMVLFLQIPPEQLEAQKGLLRCLISTLVRMIGAVGQERKGEVLFLLDEASSLGSLSALEEALVRGRSAGVRLLLAYQSDAQVRAAFKDKPTLLYDNCATQVYLGAGGIESADRLSKSLGEWTQVVEGYGQNNSRSWNLGSYSPGQGEQRSHGGSFNYSVTGRALLRPEEILTLSDRYLIVLQRGMAPILARRIRWYRDPAFNPAAGRGAALLCLGLLAAAAALAVWAVIGR